MSSISAIALSGMNAAVRRLELSASNVANAESFAALPAANGTVPADVPRAYAPLRLIPTESAGGLGVQTSVSTVAPPSRSPIRRLPSPIRMARSLRPTSTSRGR
jgi:flagellar basal-body rod protein FlgC